MKDLVRYSLDKLSQYNSLHVLVDYAEPETKILYDAYCLHIEGLIIFTLN
jgi:hypothetical protein